MPKITVPGKRLTADVTHKIEPMIEVTDINGQTWHARTLFLNLDRAKNGKWEVVGIDLSIAKKTNYAFYKSTKLGVDIDPNQNPQLEEIIDKYIEWVSKDTQREGA